MRLLTFALGMVLGSVRPATAGTLTPIDGGAVTATSVLINGASGDQHDPHVSGNLAAYTDYSSGLGEIRYYNFSTGVDTAIPKPADSYDFLPDMSGHLITFTRVLADRNAIMLFDTSTGVLTELAPRRSNRFRSAVGGQTVAWVDQSAGQADIYSYDISTATVSTVSTQPFNESLPSVSPDGAAILWQLCFDVATCKPYKAIRSSGGSWGVSAVTSSTDDTVNVTDTDGTTIVYDGINLSTGEANVYLVPQSGGEVMRLALSASGFEATPRISSGVISFRNRSTSTPGRLDLFIYVIATNTLYQVTNTPAVSESSHDITVLSNGSIRMVWAANDGATGDLNIQGATFAVPLSKKTYSWSGFLQPMDDLPAVNSVKAGSAVPVNFSLGGDFGVNIFAPGYPVSAQIACDTVAPVNAIEATVTAGSTGLSYDSSTGLYTYIWKTDKSWAGTCRQLTVKLADGTLHSANFAYK